MILLIVGFTAVAGFLAIPYRIYQAHKTRDAEIGDYAFIAFLSLVIVGAIKFYVTGV